MYSIANTTFQQYKKATLYFSSNSASIVNVIPAMDKLDAQLNPRKKTVYHPAIIATMSLARKKLNRYYELTDLSDPYHIAMGKCRYLIVSCSTLKLFPVLHPGLKPEYFRTHGWEPDWIESAELITWNAFTNYDNFHSADEDPGTTSVNEVWCFILEMNFRYLFYLKEEDNDFGNVCVGNLVQRKLLNWIGILSLIL